MFSIVTISGSVVISIVVLGVVVVSGVVVVLLAHTCCNVHFCKAGSKYVNTGHLYRVFKYMPRIFEHKKYVVHDRSFEFSNLPVSVQSKSATVVAVVV